MFRTKVVEKIRRNILCSVKFFSENCAVYEIVGENMAEPELAQMAI